MKLKRDPESEWQARRPQRLRNKDPFEALVLSVPDGDTLCVTGDWDGCSWSYVEYIRLAGIDAPEMRSQNAVHAIRSQLALQRLVYQKVVTVRPQRVWRDPYSRIIASVTLDDRDIGTCLIESGHAKTRIRTKPPQTR